MRCFCGLHLVEALTNLVQMLVGEELVDAEIVVSPREMGGGAGFLSCSGASRDAVHGYVVVDDSHLSGRQQSELDAGGKASGISHVHGLCRSSLVYLGQAIDK